MNKESLVKEQIDFKAAGEEISHELAAKMIKDHHDKFSYEESYSYTIGRNIIEAILSQPGCVAITFRDAINEAGEKTLVYVGVDSKGNSLLEYTSVNEHGKIVVTPGMTGDRSLPGAWLGL